MRLALVAALLLMLVPVLARAQDLPGPVGLLADDIRYDRAARTLTASGNVTILSEDTIVQTDRLIYDAATGTVRFPGPVTLQDGTSTVLQASGMALDANLQAGIIQSVKAIIDADFTLVANAASRTEGRYTGLTKVVASTCDVCEESDVPAWQFRADRVVYDAERDLVHYENAFFDLFGVPVFYFPYIRHAGPSVERSSGVLAPSFTRSNRYGVAMRLPFYAALSQSEDITLTPFITETEGTILETEYRRRFDDADVLLTSSYLDAPRDRTLDERWHFVGEGTMGQTDQVRTQARLEVVSDDSFLSEFGYSRADRLPSFVVAEHYDRNGFWSLGTIYYTSLRADEPQGSIPFVLPEGEAYEIVDRSRRYGGQLALKASTVTLTREDGRDSTRLTAGGILERTDPTPMGIQLRTFLETDGDIYFTQDDPAFPTGPVYRIRPVAGIEARLPFYRNREGLAEVLEPVAQVVFAAEDDQTDEIPNEDSQQVDFDETNLFATSRFPGEDRYEPGARLDLGLRYERISDAGWTTTATLGQVIRQEDTDVFTSGSGLDGAASSYVTSVSLDFRDRLGVDTRLLTDPSGVVTRSEVLGRFTDGRVRLVGTYVFLRDESTTGTPVDRTEVAFNGRFPISGRWNGLAGVRRDIEEQRYIDSQLGAIWASDCAEVAISVERDYTRSENVEPTTEYALTFRFNGLGDANTATTRRQCAAQ